MEKKISITRGAWALDSTFEGSMNNVSITDLSKEELSKEYDKLKKQFLMKSKDNEVHKQIIYAMELNVSRLTKLESDYQQEIEILQAGDTQECNKLQRKIAAMEMENSISRQNFEEQLLMLQDDLKARDAKIGKLEAELDTLAKVKNKVRVSEEVFDEITTENAALKVEMEQFVQMLEEMKAVNSEVELRNCELTSTLKDLEQQNEKLSDMLDSKRDEVSEAKALQEMLQEDLLVLKTEMESIKSKPLDELSRGNSLFAEVDDRRIQLQNNMTKMRTGYVDMKNENVALLTRLDTLRSENLRLIERWESDVCQRENGEHMVLKAHKERIAVLEELVKSYEEKMSVTLSDQLRDASLHITDEMQHILNMREIYKEETRQLMEKLNKQSKTQLMLTRGLEDSNSQCRQWRLEASDLKAQLDKMKIERDLSSLETSPTKVAPAPAECAECSRRKRGTVLATSRFVSSLPKFKPKASAVVEMDLATYMNSRVKKAIVKTEPVDSEKENVAVVDNENSTEQKEKVSKSVKFSEDTVGTNVTNRKTFRRPGKIITGPVIHLDL